MARTQEGAALTEQHRQTQLQLRSQALRDFLVLWPLWTGDDQSFGSLIQAAIPLVNVYHRSSATLAGAYYQAFRRAERIPGDVTSRIPVPVPPEQIARSMYATGQATAREALAAGRSAEQARRSALVATSGAVTRHVLAGGRETILETAATDEQALGWARVTDSAPCPFCLMLASRGPVYKTEQTADFQAHGHCGCGAEPVYRDSHWPGRAREFLDIYNRAQHEAEAAGELDRGTENDRLNALRRYLAKEE